MSTLSLDLRRRILDSYDAGEGTRQDIAAIRMMEKAGAEARFLPPYSPDLNPIEQMWSKVKQLLRGMKARSQEALLDATGLALSCVTEADALGWFAPCGYGLN